MLERRTQQAKQMKPENVHKHKQNKITKVKNMLQNLISELVTQKNTGKYLVILGFLINIHYKFYR